MADNGTALMKMKKRFARYRDLKRELKNQYSRLLKAQIITVELLALNNMLEADKLLLQAYQTGQPVDVIQEARQLVAYTYKTWCQLRDIISPKKQEKKKKWIRGKKSWDVFKPDYD